MVLDPLITTNLTLNVEEKWQILQRIDEMDLFSFPNNFSANPSGWITPQEDYYIKVQNGSQTKEISWNNNSLMDINIQSNLKQPSQLYSKCNCPESRVQSIANTQRRTRLDSFPKQRILAKDRTRNLAYSSGAS